MSLFNVIHSSHQQSILPGKQDPSAVVDVHGIKRKTQTNWIKRNGIKSPSYCARIVDQKKMLFLFISDRDLETA